MDVIRLKKVVPDVTHHNTREYLEMVSRFSKKIDPAFDVWDQLTPKRDVAIWIPQFTPGVTFDPFSCKGKADVVYYVLPLSLKFTQTSKMTSRDYFTGSLFVRGEYVENVKMDCSEQLPDACNRFTIWCKAPRHTNP